MSAVAILLSAIAMTAIVGVRYLVVSGGFALATRAKHPGLYAGLEAQMRREIGWSLASAAIYGVPAGVLAWGWQAHGWTRVYVDVHAWPLWWLPVSVLLYLALHDTWFYWTHRWMHRPRPFRAMHAVHHASRPPTAWAAMSFHPSEALTGAVVIPALVLAIPIHVVALGLVLAIMTVMGVTNHMGWELFSRRLVMGGAGRWLITASHHQRHHADYRCNYGLYFRFWDRLCDTDRGWARLTLAVAALAVLPGAAPIASLEVSVTGLRSTRGLIQVCITARPDGFPDACEKDPAARRMTVPATRTTAMRFDDMPAGTYAIALFHDENGNGRLDKRFGFIPAEGIGFSNNPRIRFGAPSFAAASITLTNAPLGEAIKMQYFL